MRHESRAGEWGSSAIPSPGSGTGQGAALAGAILGRAVQPDAAAGLPAAMAAIRLIAELTASLELGVFRRRADGTEERPTARQWQARLLSGPDAQPAMDWDIYSWVCDMSAGPEGFGNSFARKVKDRATGQVLELIPLDPDYVRVRNDGGTKVFDWHDQETKRTVRGLTPYDILHVRGFSLHGLLSGVSPVAYHAASIARALAMEEFAGRFFANDATPGVVLQYPGNLTVRQAQRHLLLWRLRHAGARHSHAPAIVSNGTKVERLGVSAVDAQLIEGLNYGVVDTARIYRVPASLLEAFIAARNMPSVEQESLRLLVFYLLPRLMRFQSAINSDVDMFRGTGLYVRFITDNFVRVDARTQAEVDHNRIQDGTRTRNELRRRDGLADLPPQPDDPVENPGDVIPVTPVGAGANPPKAEPAEEPAPAEEEE